MVRSIRELAVRGAPLIGIAAGFALVVAARAGASSDELREQARALRAARPTAVNLMTTIDRLLSDRTDAELTFENLEQLMLALFQEDVDLCDRIAAAGQGFLRDGQTVLTHCNTGALATVGRGTALGIITAAHEAGMRLHVVVDETRPLLQGARLTTYELERAGIPYTLICDNMAASMMRAGRIDCAIVGADRIAANGDFANKIGTYSLAVVAHAHDVPLYVAAPWTTIDPACAGGDGIPIEERGADEVRGFADSRQSLVWSPRQARVFNPAFDVTPGELVEGYVLDVGFVARGAVGAGALVRAHAQGLQRAQAGRPTASH